MDKEIPFIEIEATSIYFAIVGNIKSINKLINRLSANNTDPGIIYVAASINIPIAKKCDELMTKYKQHISIGSGVEVAQCHVYAEGYDSNNQFVLVLSKTNNEYILKFPEIEVNGKNEPDSSIMNWIKERIDKVPKSIKETLRPVYLVGESDDILVFSAMCDE